MDLRFRSGVRRRAAVFAGAVVSLVLLAAAGQAYAAGDVYVAASSGVADEFSIGSTGALTFLGSVHTGTRPIQVAVGVHTQFLVAKVLVAKVTSVYVTNYDDNTVSQYTVASNGHLVPKSPATVPTGPGPVGVAVSPNGKNVYVANTEDSAVSQYSVTYGGKLVPKTPATVPAGTQPSLVAVTADSSNVYVTNLFDNTVSQYTAALNGSLTPNSPPTVAAGNGPYGIAPGQTKQGSTTINSVYVVNVYDNTVSQYTVGAGGKLVPKAPATVPTGSFPQEIAVSPGTNSAYVSNESDNTLSQYTVEPNGALSPNGTVPTDTAPGGIAVKK